MPSRRSHQKSHHGCTTCKKRRVKCDETRPKCANCMRRGTDCDYLSGYVPTTPESTNNGSGPVVENALPSSFLGQVLDSRVSQVSATSQPGRHFSSTQLFDLMLMNHWTTSTWKSLLDQEDKFQHLWQSVIPAEAASYPFLMHELLALSALHQASESIHNPDKYRERRAVALRHHDQSVALFRPVLNKITQQNCHAVFAFSALLVILSLALPGFPLEETTKSPVEELLTVITLLKGVQGVLESSFEWILPGPLGVLLAADLMNATADIPPEFKAALSRLKAHNSSLYTQEVEVAEAYSLALERLEQCASRLYSKPLDRPKVLGWMIIVPDRFDSLLRDGHPMAQVILAHFAVILLTYDFWWSGDWGKALIQEIAQRLTDEWKPMVRFPLEQVATMNAQSLKNRLEMTSAM